MSETINKTTIMLKLIKEVPEFLPYFSQDTDLTLEQGKEIFEMLYANKMYDMMMLFLYDMEYNDFIQSALREFREKAVLHLAECKGDEYIADLIISEVRNLKQYVIGN